MTDSRSSTFSSMTEKEVREKLIAAHTACRYKLEEVAVNLASLMVAYKRSATQEQVQAARKNNAFTALSEQLTWYTAVIEFIESLGVFRDNGNQKSRLKDELVRRHSGLLNGIERSALDLSGDSLATQQICMEAREKGIFAALGERRRSSLAGKHVRMMKDLAVIGYIQSLGVVSRLTRRSDL